jgi:hypothetical protein
MKVCCFCNKVEPKKDLFYNEETGENAHLKCVRTNMSLRADKNLMKKADKFAWLLVDKDRKPPK